MRVLVVESDLGGARDLRATLTERGHDVHSCYADPYDVGGCTALDPEVGCPLDRQQVDAVVDVRPFPHPAPRLQEQGAICAVRKRLPLVIAGTEGHEPFAPWATSVVGTDVDEVADAVEAVEGSRSPTHQRVVDEALDALLPGEGATAFVRRDEGRLHVALSLPAETDAAEAERIGVQVVAAVRRFDPITSVVDVATAAPVARD